MEQLEFLKQNCTGETLMMDDKNSSVGEYANQLLSYCGPCWQTFSLFADGDCLPSSNASVTGVSWCAGGCMEQLEFLTQNCTVEAFMFVGEYANQMLAYCGPCWQKLEAVQDCFQPADAAMCEWCEMEVGDLAESCKDEYFLNTSHSAWAEGIKYFGEHYCQNMNTGPKCMKIGIETAKRVGAIFC
mmetsp:Transcript_85015/g.243990  ORF Transcript_85015/g.243990 Transcript_85015/m.243990 type:complete len:186 (-) Transcript_85015:114-671(-)